MIGRGWNFQTRLLIGSRCTCPYCPVWTSLLILITRIANQTKCTWCVGPTLRSMNLEFLTEGRKKWRTSDEKCSGREIFVWDVLVLIKCLQNHRLVKGQPTNDCGPGWWWWWWCQTPRWRCSDLSTGAAPIMEKAAAEKYNKTQKRNTTQTHQRNTAQTHQRNTTQTQPRNTTQLHKTNTTQT